MAWITQQLEDGVLTLSLNRPEKKNAVHAPLLEELEDHLDRHRDDSDVRVLVLRGEGGCFCAGADIQALNRYGPEEMRGFHDLRERVLARLEEFPSPSVAVIEGYALGTGLELALSTDFRLAADDAAFGIPSSRLGVTESYPYTARLVRCVGLARTQFLILTGERIGASEARDLGLVERVYPAASLWQEVGALAGTVASNAPHAVRGAKQIARHCWRDPLLEQVEDPAGPFVASSGGSELTEGTGAFLDKRKARFQSTQKEKSPCGTRS